MQVTVRGITQSHKESVLASAAIELSDGNGATVLIEDLRVLRNKQGSLWVAMPSYSVPLGGKGYEYRPTVILSRALQREVEDRVLSAYEEWARQQQPTAGVV